MSERIFKNLGLFVMAGLMVAWLSGCGQSEDVAQSGHDHDGGEEHSHSHDSDGEGHHEGEDNDAEGHHDGEDNDASETSNIAALVGDVDLVAQKAAYPLKTCVVGGESLGSMGDPVEFVHEGRLVQFCCEGCIDDFKKDSTKYLAKLDQALTEAATTATETK
ncbi:hypothetical protein OAH36_00970 [Verrucomicrobia bacterium]|jgi:hypothetical protein|nr:hypothetical protein [Verrucomicrobiota bacterium]